MERILPATDMEELLGATIAVLSLSRPSRGAGTLVAIPGQGEDCRVSKTIELWQDPGNQYDTLLIAGDDHSKGDSRVLSLDHLKQHSFGLRRTVGVMVDGHRENTKTQVNWVAEMIEQFDITMLTISVISYHLVRVYLTLIRSLNEREIIIPIIPAPIFADLSTVSPETEVEMWRLVPGEARRIFEYQKKGDVATFNELKGYLDWFHRIMAR